MENNFKCPICNSETERVRSPHLKTTMYRCKNPKCGTWSKEVKNAQSTPSPLGRYSVKPY
jgi:endogenous inhibitor of DNA gyrase (YacG/DUF329 family)